MTRSGFTHLLVLVFFLLVSTVPKFSHSQVLKDGSCPPVPMMRNFSPDKFLGSWYEIERYYSDAQVNTKCNKIDFSYNHDGRIGVLTSAIQERSGLPALSHGHTNFDYSDSARMTLSMSPTPGSPVQRDLAYWVLDTDYESYAVIFSCEDVCRGRQHSESLWVLGRTALLPPQVLNRIYDKVRVAGLDPKKLMKVDQHKCVNVAVSVRSENSLSTSNAFDRNSARKFLASLTSVFGKRNKYF